MHVAIAGAHGKVARLLTRLLTERGDEVTGLVRDPGHVADVTADGARAVVVDLEAAGAAEVAGAVRGADAVVFAAGAGPGSGAARKDTVDRAAAVLLADAAELAGVRGYLLVSSFGVDAVRGGATPEGVDEVFVAYLRAKLAAEEELLARAASGRLHVTVLRPGGLTDEPPTGRVHLERSVERGSVPRADVAAVCVELLDAAASVPVGGRLLELVGGEEPAGDAVARVAAHDGGAAG
ncbi:NAD(P)H-binding protein [Kineococcus indalonis]|uniref:NAD(P)H-binding protein n=1 Tax=Kineococcus indalonis TaxID=2696566 RepID=UPI00141254EF|nr:NAD(P)-binding oxidoreductase [Kineococcus indalonis]NAZ88723.1 NAD(P)H-binding protein [Kineococcus indalonis]